MGIFFNRNKTQDASEKKKTGIDKLVMGAIVGAAVGSVIGLSQKQKEHTPEQLNLLDDGAENLKQKTIAHKNGKNLKLKKEKTGFFARLFRFKKREQEVLKSIPQEPAEEHADDKIQ